MIIKTDDIKDICSKILFAVDSSELSLITETLELKTNDDFLYLAVTNREYYAQVKMSLTEKVELHATVNATLFLKLISQITTENIEIETDDSSLIIKGNGTYKLPLIFDDDKLLELPTININNVTSEFNISGDILNSILNYNSKELTRGIVSRPVQKLYYVDENGAITFTSGACVNNFTLEKPIKILLNNKIVKLFKLFKAEDVAFSLGYDQTSAGIVQTKVKFETSLVSISAILSCDDSLLASVPVTAIRGRATNNYPYSISVNKDEFIQTINRLMLFSTSQKALKPISKIIFDVSSMTIFDNKLENKETINYNASVDSCSYEMMIDLMDIKSVLDTCSEQYVNINFGDSQAIVISRGNVHNVIPEVREV